MAPNTVKLHQLTSAFATIDKDAIFNRKTTPLLSDVETQQSQQQQQQEEQNIFSADYMIAKQLKDNAETQTSSSATSSSDDYWGWSNDETSTQRQAKETKRLIAKILEEEEIRVMLSSEALERREVEAASASDASPVCEYEEGESSDVGYWTWSADTHDNKYEFSVERIEERLSEVSVAQNEQITTPAGLPKSNVSEGGYWDWANDESCSAEERKQKEVKALIAKLLEEEEIRMSFMATEISARLLQESGARSSTEEVKEEQEIVGAENGGYWDW